METLKCFFKKCRNIPKATCNSESLPIYMCKNHILTHTGSSPLRHHEMINLYIPIDPNTQDTFIRKCNQLKLQIKTLKIGLIRDSRDFIVNFQSIFNASHQKLKMIEEQLNGMIKIAINKEFLNTEADKEIKEILKLAKSEAESRMKYWYVPKVEIDYNKIESYIFRLHEKYDILPFLSDPPVISELETKEITKVDAEIEKTIIMNKIYVKKTPMFLNFMKHDSKEFISVDLETSEYESTTLDLKTDITTYAGSVALPDKSTFFYSNGNDTSGIAFIVDKDKNVIEMPDGKPNVACCLIYYENSVYAIGGWHKISEKFNLDSKK